MLADVEFCRTFATAFEEMSNHHDERAFSSAGSEHLPYKQRVGGSNPSTPTRFAEIAQLVEHNLAKVGVASSSLVFRSSSCCYSSVVEHFLGKEEVTSSSLVNSSTHNHCFSFSTRE